MMIHCISKKASMQAKRVCVVKALVYLGEDLTIKHIPASPLALTDVCSKAVVVVDSLFNVAPFCV